MDFNDPRFEYISEYVLKTFKLKPDKWTKLVGNEEYKQVVIEFFEKTDNSQLVIVLSNTGQLIPEYAFPAACKNKTVYFLKREKKDPITKDGYKGSLLSGDLSSAPLDQLSALVEEVGRFFICIEREFLKVVLLFFTNKKVKLPQKKRTLNICGGTFQS